MSNVHYNTKRRFRTSFRDLFFMIGSGVAFLSLFLAILLPGACKSAGSGEFFAVCSGSYTTRARAEERASAMQRAGGGGFVWNNGMFQVISAVYTDRADCENVLEGLGKGHKMLVLKVPSHAEEVGRITERLAEIYYGLDTKAFDGKEGLVRLERFLGQEKFPETAEGEPGKDIFGALGNLDETDLSVNLKYFQAAFVCAFAEGGKS